MKIPGRRVRFPPPGHNNAPDFAFGEATRRDTIMKQIANLLVFAFTASACVGPVSDHQRSSDTVVIDEAVSEDLITAGRLRRVYGGRRS